MGADTSLALKHIEADGSVFIKFCGQVKATHQHVYNILWLILLHGVGADVCEEERHLRR